MKARTSWLAISFVLLSTIILSACGGGAGTNAGNNGNNGDGGTSGSGGVTITEGSVLTYVADTDAFSAGGTHISGPVIADFNGDGKPDIAVANADTNNIEVFLNNGKAQFGAPILTPVVVPGGTTMTGLAVGDFNEDGKPDLVISWLSNNGQVQASAVLLGKGDGTFTQQPPIPNSYAFSQAVVTDLNGDGHQDLVFAGYFTASVALGKGDGTFVETALPLTINCQPFENIGCFGGVPVTAPVNGIAVADFNSDGKLDIAAITATAINGSEGSFFLYPGNGDGTFQSDTVVGPSNSTFIPGFVSSLASGDFLNNGGQDLLIGSAYDAEIVPGNGDGTFKWNSISLEPADEPDITVYASPLAPPPPTPPILAPPIPPPGALVNSVAADLTGDGKADVVTADPLAGIVQITLNTAIGQPIPNLSNFEAILAPGVFGLAIGDLDNDGVKDVVVLNGQTGSISLILSAFE